MQRDHDPGRLATIPSISELLAEPRVARAVSVHSHRLVVDEVRAAQDAIRQHVRGGGQVPALDQLVADILMRVSAAISPGLGKAINATGVLLHTNLGRAPLSEAAREAVLGAAGSTALEMDLVTGRRGQRLGSLNASLARLMGTPAATVVNNGAAALFLGLAALADNREVVVSRGELVEIGGSFRLPDIMATAGVRLREVGTTNRTRAGDYLDAAGEQTGLLLKVHRSNFAQIGFVEEPTVEALADVARDVDVPLVFDVGSGLLDAVDVGPLSGEPGVRDAVRDGADLVIVSGDKLLGGPQAGILAGRADLVERCTRHPLFRALRIDKLQRAALEATVVSHLRGAAAEELPLGRMLAVETDVLRDRALGLRARLERVAADHDVGVEVAELQAVVGGGTSPGATLASAGLRIRGRHGEALAAALRAGDPPVVPRIEHGQVQLDLRTIDPSDDEIVATGVEDAIQRVYGS